MKNKTTRKNKNKNRTSTGRISMKGKHGKVGAPPKSTKFPKTPFTIAALKKRNTNQCELSLRNKVDTMLDAGTLIPITPRKQANGGVGRPAPRYILKENFDASKYEKAERPVKTGKRPEVTATHATQLVPAEAPSVTAPVLEPVAAVVPPPVETAPVVSEPAATEPSNVIQAPVTPAPLEQAA